MKSILILFQEQMKFGQYFDSHLKRNGGVKKDLRDLYFTKKIQTNLLFGMEFQVQPQN